MDAPVRIAFDTSLPFVAAQAFTAAGRSYADGESVPWRELGLREDEIHAWWRANLVRCVPMTQVCTHVLYDAKVTVDTSSPASSTKQRARR